MNQRLSKIYFSSPSICNSAWYFASKPNPPPKGGAKSNLKATYKDKKHFFTTEVILPKRTWNRWMMRSGKMRIEPAKAKHYDQAPNRPEKDVLLHAAQMWV